MSVVEQGPASAEHPAESVRGPEIEPIVRSLEARVSAPRALLEQVVAEELLRFRGARIPTFVPILVERAAADRLAALSADARRRATQVG